MTNWWKRLLGLQAAALLVFAVSAQAQPEVPEALFVNALSDTYPVHFSVADRGEKSFLERAWFGWVWSEGGREEDWPSLYPGPKSFRVLESLSDEDHKVRRTVAKASDLGFPTLGRGPGRELWLLVGDEDAVHVAQWEQLLDTVESAYRQVISPGVGGDAPHRFRHIGELGSCQVWSFPLSEERSSGGWQPHTLDQAAPEAADARSYERGSPAAKKVRVHRFLRWLDNCDRFESGPKTLRLFPLFDQPGQHFLEVSEVPTRSLGWRDVAPDDWTSGSRKVASLPAPDAATVELSVSEVSGDLCKLGKLERYCEDEAAFRQKMYIFGDPDGVPPGPRNELLEACEAVLGRDTCTVESFAKNVDGGPYRQTLLRDRRVSSKPFIQSTFEVGGARVHWMVQPEAEVQEGRIELSRLGGHPIPLLVIATPIWKEPWVLWGGVVGILAIVVLVALWHAWWHAWMSSPLAWWARSGSRLRREPAGSKKTSDSRLTSSTEHLPTPEDRDLEAATTKPGVTPEVAPESATEPDLIDDQEISATISAPPLPEEDADRASLENQIRQARQELKTQWEILLQHTREVVDQELGAPWGLLQVKLAAVIDNQQLLERTFNIQLEILRHWSREQIEHLGILKDELREYLNMDQALQGALGAIHAAQEIGTQTIQEVLGTSRTDLGTFQTTALRIIAEAETKALGGIGEAMANHKEELLSGVREDLQKELPGRAKDAVETARQEILEGIRKDNQQEISKAVETHWKPYAGFFERTLPVFEDKTRLNQAEEVLRLLDSNPGLAAALVKLAERLPFEGYLPAVAPDHLGILEESREWADKHGRAGYTRIGEEVARLEPGEARETFVRALESLGQLGFWIRCLWSALQQLFGSFREIVDPLPEPARQEWLGAFRCLRSFELVDAPVFRRVARWNGDGFLAEADWKLLDLEDRMRAHLVRPGDQGIVTQAEWAFLESSGLASEKSLLVNRVQSYLIQRGKPGRLGEVCLALQYLVEAFPKEHVGGSRRSEVDQHLRATLTSASLPPDFHSLIRSAAEGTGFIYRPVPYYRSRLDDSHFAFIERSVGAIDLAERIGIAVDLADPYVIVRLDSPFFFAARDDVYYTGRACIARQ